MVSIYQQHIQQKRLDVNRAHPAQLKETAEEILKFVQKRCNNWPIMSFIQSGSETRIYRISSDNKLDAMYGGQLSQYKSLTSFDDDAENILPSFLMYVQIAGTNIYICSLKLHTKCSKPSKLNVPTKSKAIFLKTSLQLQTISTRTLELYTNSLKQLFLSLHL